MATPRAKTMIERAGFKDEDLKTPEHDRIMLWLDSNIEEVIRNLFGSDLWPEDEVRKHRDSAAKQVENDKNQLVKQIQDEEEILARYKEEGSSSLGKILGPEYKAREIAARKKSLHEKKDRLQELKAWGGIGDPPAPHGFTVRRKKWEAAIRNRDYVVGSIDFLVQINRPVLDIKVADGFPQWENGYGAVEVLFEVKSQIKSLGELLRQIRFYQEYQRGIYVVVSPDDRFAGVLRDQGIRFVLAPKGEGNSLKTGEQQGLF